MGGVAASPLGRLNGRVTTWLARTAAVILGLLAVMTFADVAARYFFNRPFSFSVEITELAMGLIVYLSVGMTTHEKGHICVDVVTLRLSDRMRALFELATGLLALAFLAAMIWRLWLRAGALFAKGDYTPIWYIPIWPVAYVMAAASILFFTGTLLHVAAAAERLAAARAPR